MYFSAPSSDIVRISDFCGEILSVTPSEIFLRSYFMSSTVILSSAFAAENGTCGLKIIGIAIKIARIIGIAAAIKSMGFAIIPLREF